MDDIIEFSIPISADSKGYTGRECPECEKYFKIKSGTGIKGEVPCHCPYCGCCESQDKYWTKDQLEYAESKALNKISCEVIKSLKQLERKPNPRALFSLGVKVDGKPIPILQYSEKDLEEEIKCDNCTLEYTIYGMFGFCPDCGIHNSLQIFNANLAVIENILKIAQNSEPGIAHKLLENALEDIVSSFDGFGRELCKVHSNKTVKPYKAEHISFQSITKSRKTLNELFGFDFAESIPAATWKDYQISFEKRHLIAHKMGIIDERYTELTGCPKSLIGRKIDISDQEVRNLLRDIRKLAQIIFSKLNSL